MTWFITLIEKQLLTSPPNQLQLETFLVQHVLTMYLQKQAQGS